MKVLELKGYDSLRAFNAYSALVLGLNMLPSYRNEHFEDFYKRLKELPEQDQVKILREAAFFVELNKNEVEAMVSFCTDSNGVPYDKTNMKNLGLKELFECVIAVAVQISKIDIDLISESEKKNLKTFQ